MIASVRALWARAKGFDVTGLYVWPSSYVLARWLVTRAAAAPSTLEHKVVFDLGSGCGLAGLTAALVGNAAEVHLSDLVPNVLSNLRHNVMLNQERASVQWRAPSVELIDWQDSTTWPQSGSADLVLGADLVYDDGRRGFACKRAGAYAERRRRIRTRAPRTRPHWRE